MLYTNLERFNIKARNKNESQTKLLTWREQRTGHTNQSYAQKNFNGVHPSLFSNAVFQTFLYKSCLSLKMWVKFPCYTFFAPVKTARYVGSTRIVVRIVKLSWAVGIIPLINSRYNLLIWLRFHVKENNYC